MQPCSAARRSKGAVEDRGRDGPRQERIAAGMRRAATANDSRGSASTLALEQVAQHQGEAGGRIVHAKGHATQIVDASHTGRA